MMSIKMLRLPSMDIDSIEKNAPENLFIGVVQHNADSSMQFYKLSIFIVILMKI